MIFARLKTDITFFSTNNTTKIAYVLKRGSIVVVVSSDKEQKYDCYKHVVLDVNEGNIIYRYTSMTFDELFEGL